MNNLGLNKELERGQIVMVDFGESKGSIQGGLRPALIVSNNKANHFSPVIICVPLTSKINKKPLPTHALIEPCQTDNNLIRASVALCEQIITITKDSVRTITGKISKKDCERIDECVRISLAL